MYAFFNTATFNWLRIENENHIIPQWINTLAKKVLSKTFAYIDISVHSENKFLSAPETIAGKQ